MTTHQPITTALRKAILDSGLSYLRIEQETGVQRASIMRFVRGTNSLRLDLADKLAVYFELTLTQAPRRKG
ncbi:helix-turn-helix domain-containing protein [Fimbriiglobus ruber]|uniref:HTH cro/C1-type domain-containing protein n=1 Tax=Fimbriiglobus ruber TaxID=1908690 RepID=A0A225DRB1_9BACT|nr:helix-turn-helix transcriptional regulator [Fimbriiglobus ruber]OWK44030.1 hypothetical protein FRUB_03629 [Fimbriiglobus ruber]